jgi:geranylgeranyl pyrophosphate synthase
MSSSRPRTRRPGRIRRRLAPRLEPELLGAEVRDFLGRLDRTLEDLAGGEGAPPGFDPQRLVRPGFIRIRPWLVYSSARAVMQDSELPPELDTDGDTEHVALAAELLHLAVLVHDAALGRQGGRRRRAARRLLGGAIDILGANHLTLRALELARLSPKPETIGDLLEAMREIAESHVLAQSQGEDFPTVQQTMSVAEGRNGAVFSFSCRSGGRLGGGERQAISALGRYGRHAGVAWHLAEDMALVDATELDTAQLLADRAQASQVGIVISLAAEQDGRIKDAWRSLGGSGDPGEALDFAAAVRATGAMQRGRQHLITETWAAQRALQALPGNAHRENLRQLVTELAS